MRRLVLDRSRHGRAAEIVGWSNATAAFLAAGATGVRTRAPLGALLTFVVAFASLRLMLAHRRTIGVAAMAGSVAVAATTGGLAWLFAHLVDAPGFADAMAVVGAVVGGAVPAWAYADLAAKRHARVPDSLVTASAPSSSER